jgi:hypothetical protein
LVVFFGSPFFDLVVEVRGARGTFDFRDDTWAAPLETRVLTHASAANNANTT